MNQPRALRLSKPSGEVRTLTKALASRTESGRFACSSVSGSQRMERILFQSMQAL